MGTCGNGIPHKYNYTIFRAKTQRVLQKICKKSAAFLPGKEENKNKTVSVHAALRQVEKQSLKKAETGLTFAKKWTITVMQGILLISRKLLLIKLK